MTRDLNEAEIKVLNMLGECFNEYRALVVLHPCDLNEFMQAIHVAQNIILARPNTEIINVQKSERS